MAISFKENFRGYCPHCDHATLENADFCHHCGSCLVTHSAQNHPEASIIDSQHLQNLIKETSNLFLIWCCFISFLGATGLIYYFYHSLSPIIVGAVGFAYIWIFLTAKLDELAIAIHYKLKSIAYLSLLIPMVGTIFCFQQMVTRAQHLVEKNHAI